MAYREAYGEFAKHWTTIKGQLEKIQNHVEYDMEPEPDQCNWGHVGSAEKVATDLNKIMAFLGLKEEDE